MKRLSKLVLLAVSACPQIPVTPEWPAVLSATGVYSDSRGTTFAPGFFAYQVQVPFWSSGAEKRRAACIPGDAPLRLPRSGEVELPEGSILVKEFSYPLATGLTRLETRLAVRRDGKWSFRTYRWRADQKEATRVDLPETLTLAAAGGSSVRWELMAGYRCDFCHTVGTRSIPLGWTTEQLSGQTQIADWIRAGRVEPSTDAAALARYPELNDPSLSPYRRARLYLAVNCAHCHQPGAWQPILDLRAETPLAQTKMIDRVPTVSNLGIADARVVKPFRKESSVLWLRLRATNSLHMPPLGAALPDERAIAFIGEWIDSGAAGE